MLGGGDLEAAVAALTRTFQSSGLLRNRRLVVQVRMGLYGTCNKQRAMRAIRMPTLARGTGVRQFAVES